MKAIVRLLSLFLIISLILASFVSCISTPNGDGSGDNSSDGGSADGVGDGSTPLPPYGNQLGKRCITTDLALVSGNGTVNVKDYVGKVVVINFWGTWCGPCKNELPHFNEVADEYSDSVVIITVHSNWKISDAPDYVSDNFSDSGMIFAKDDANDKYYKALNPGENSYPITVVLDKNGVITYKVIGAISKNTLVSEINKVK